MTMRHVVIAGGGAALASIVAEEFLSDPEVKVTAVCRKTRPRFVDERLTVLDGVDLCREGDKVPTGGRGAGALVTLAPIDVLVTLTGYSADWRLESLGLEGWNPTLDSTLKAVYMSLRYALPALQASNGNVVVVGSVVGSTGGYGCGAYAAAKAGLVGLVRAAANENARHGVCVNLLELGYVNAGMGARLPEAVKERLLPTIPLGRFAEPREVAEAVEFLSRIRYATGSVFPLTGGLR